MNTGIGQFSCKGLVKNSFIVAKISPLFEVGRYQVLALVAPITSGAALIPIFAIINPADCFTCMNHHENKRINILQQEITGKDRATLNRLASYRRAVDEQTEQGDRFLFFIHLFCNQIVHGIVITRG